MSDQPKLPPGWEEGPDDSRQRELQQPKHDEPLSKWLAFYLSVNPRITSTQTGRRYRTMLNNLDDFIGRPAVLSDLTPDLIARWVQHRRDVDRVSAGTLRGETEKALVIWRWVAARCGESMPMVKLPRGASKLPEAWVPEQVEKLDAAARAADWWVGGVPANLYWPALINVAIETGERHAAIHALRWSDIDFDQSRIHFRAETRKGRVRDNRKPLSKATLEDLRLLMVASPKAPFGVLKMASLYHPMRRLLAEAGLREGRNNMFHAFRRYHATQVHLAGGDATASLGHTDPSLARKSYIDPTQIPSVTPTLKRPGLLTRLGRLVGVAS